MSYYRKDFDAMPAPFQKLFDDQFILSMEFRNSGITDEETALLNAVLAVASGKIGSTHTLSLSLSLSR